MARTRKGTKPPGYDFWGKRPANSWNDKKLTHSLERKEAKRKLKKKVEIESDD